MPKKFSRNPGAVLRRKRVIERLEKQLLTGLKPTKEGGTEALSPKDKVRISKELETLNLRL